MSISPKQAEKALQEERTALEAFSKDLVRLRERFQEIKVEADTQRRAGGDPDHLTTLAGRLASIELLIRDQEEDVEQAAGAVERAEAALRDATEVQDAKRAREAYEQAVKTRQETVDDAVDAIFHEAARIQHALKAENAALHKHDPQRARTSSVRSEIGVRRALAGLNPKFGQALATIIDSAASLSQSTSGDRRELEAEKKAAQAEANRIQKARLLRQQIDERVAIMNARGSNPSWDAQLRKELDQLEQLRETYDETQLPAGFTRHAAA